MAMYYSDPEREHDPHALPNLEVFHYTPNPHDVDDGGEEFARGEGWYWWPCFPGCMPDGEANGPYASEEEAIADARRVYAGELSDLDPV